MNYNEYDESNYPLKEETYEIIGLSMEVHRLLGNGFSEIVYKDALEHELRTNSIHFEREKKFSITYKGIILPHHFYADFVINNSIIIEVKSQNGIASETLSQTINYLAASGLKVALIINFGEDKLKFKRLVFNKKYKVAC